MGNGAKSKDGEGILVHEVVSLCSGVFQLPARAHGCAMLSGAALPSCSLPCCQPWQELSPCHRSHMVVVLCPQPVRTSRSQL